MPQGNAMPGIAPPWVPCEPTARRAPRRDEFDIELGILPDLSEAGPDSDQQNFATPIHYEGKET